MLTLQEEASGVYQEFIDDEMEVFLIEVGQEIATRRVEDDGLERNRRTLERLALKPRSDITRKVYELLAIVYRRLGERGSLDYLEKSENIYKDMLHINGGKIGIENIYNYSVTLVRIFENSGDATKLEEADQVLKNLGRLDDVVGLREYIVIPKVLNNSGNISKQRYTYSGETEDYVRGIENYTLAEKFWGEDTASYEWGMLQKNKAELRLAFFRRNKQKHDVIYQAHRDCVNALKYWNKENAPYQYEKTKKIADQIQSEISKLGG